MNAERTNERTSEWGSTLSARGPSKFIRHRRQILTYKDDPHTESVKKF